MHEASALPDPIASVRRRRSWPRRILIGGGVVALLAVLLFLLLTDREPLVAQPPVPNPQQVGAARQAVMQLRAGQRDSGGLSSIRFDAAHLEAIGILASNGFRPDRLVVRARGDTVSAVGSHRLPFGRWLNAGIVGGGRGTGFPTVRLTIGSVTLPAWLSRLSIDTVRILANLRGARIPSLDRIVVSTAVDNGVVSARLRVPRGSNIVDQLSGGGDTSDAPATLAAYCNLSRRQRAVPSTDLAEQVRRAFDPALPDAGSVVANRAAFTALAMLVVDVKAGELIGLEAGQIAKCRIDPVDVTIHGRADLPKHWTLSAALAVSTGTQFSRAMGEWKELADSISHQSEFAVGDPSGFSFIDLSADRSGFLSATAAMRDADAQRMANRLSTVSARELLPPSLLQLDEGLPAPVFAERYGSIDDPRFAAMTARIDAALRQSILR